MLGSQAGCWELTHKPLWGFYIRSPKCHHQGGGMSPEGCLSLTLRPGGPQLGSLWGIGTRHFLGLLAPVFSEGHGYTLCP